MMSIIRAVLMGAVLAIAVNADPRVGIDRTGSSEQVLRVDASGAWRICNLKGCNAIEQLCNSHGCLDASTVSLAPEFPQALSFENSPTSKNNFCGPWGCPRSTKFQVAKSQCGPWGCPSTKSKFQAAARREQTAAILDDPQEQLHSACPPWGCGDTNPAARLEDAFAGINNLEGQLREKCPPWGCVSTNPAAIREHDFAALEDAQEQLDTDCPPWGCGGTHQAEDFETRVANEPGAATNGNNVDWKICGPRGCTHAGPLGESENATEQWTVCGPHGCIPITPLTDEPANTVGKGGLAEPLGKSEL